MFIRLVHRWIGWISQQTGRMPSRGTELCAVVEAMWSLVLVAQGATKDDDAVQLGSCDQSPRIHHCVHLFGDMLYICVFHLHRSNKLHYGTAFHFLTPPDNLQESLRCLGSTGFQCPSR